MSKIIDYKGFIEKYFTITTIDGQIVPMKLNDVQSFYYDMIQKEYDKISPETIKRAETVLEGEVKDFDLYLRGECYGYRLFKDGDEEDACWGFLGEIGDIKEYIREYLPEQCAGLADQLELYWEDTDDYMGRIA